MYLAFKDVDLGLLIEEMKKTNYLWLIIGSFLGVYIGGIFRALRWRYFLNPIKKDIPFNNLFSTMMIGYMMNSIVPKSGEISRPVILAKMEDISRASTFGTIIVERVLDMLTLVASFGFCLFFFQEQISTAFPEYNLEKYAVILSIIILIFLIIAVILIFKLEWFENFINRLTSKILPAKIKDKVDKIIVSLINGFLFIKNPAGLVMIFILTLLLWMSYVFSTYISFWAFGIDLTLLDANLLLTIITFTLVLPLPGNSAGAFHFFCATVLIGIFLINNETALSYATLTHLINFILLVSTGFYYSFKENIKLSVKL